MPAEPPAASIPDLTPSATVGEDVRERRRGSDGGELTFGNMAVERVDNDCDSWGRHFVYFVNFWEEKGCWREWLGVASIYTVGFNLG